MTKEGRRVLYKYKGDKCEYCKTSVEEKLRMFQTFAGFDFHHIDPDKKHPNYENLIRRTLSGAQFDEVDKCALLCSNCHETLHGQNITIAVDFTLRSDGIEPIVHTLKCQIIENHETQECTLFSDEFRLLHLFKIQTGPEGSIQVKVMSGIQLRAVMDKLISETQTNGPLIVKLLADDSTVFEAKGDSGSLKITYNADFPLPITSEIKLGTKEKKNHTRIYVRNGQIIFDLNGKVFMGPTTNGRPTNTITASYDSFNERFSKGTNRD